MARVQYAFRPAKHIQRRMIVDACRRIGFLAGLEDYEYVGFGGFEFVDFDLVHRELGIGRMTSIEYDSRNQERYQFNRPFGQIDVRFDRASEVLPTLLDDPRPRIVWLDYTSRLNLEVLQDVSTCIRRLTAGSVIVATVNAHPPSPAGIRREQLVADVTEERIPPGVTDASLARWGWAAVEYAILRAEVDSSLRLRSDGAVFEQLFHFRYNDGAYMLTWGGMASTQSDRTKWRYIFDSLNQVRASDEALLIEVPILTAKEVMHLNAQLPDVASSLKAYGIPEKDCDAYLTLYRWYPPIPGPFG